MQHAQAILRRRTCTALGERESNPEKLLNHDRTNSRLVNCIEQFLMGYFGHSMPVVPYVVGTGLLRKKIPGTKARGDESDCCLGPLAAGEILLLGCLELDLKYERRRCWIGGVDEFLVSGSEGQGEKGGVKTGEFVRLKEGDRAEVRAKDYHARETGRLPSPLCEAEITTERRQTSSQPNSKGVMEPRRPLPVASTSSTSSSSTSLSSVSGSPSRNGFVSLDVITTRSSASSLASHAASQAVYLKSPEAAHVSNPKSVGYNNGRSKSSGSYAFGDIFRAVNGLGSAASNSMGDRVAPSTVIPFSTTEKRERKWRTMRKGPLFADAGVIGFEFDRTLRRLSFGLAKTSVVEMNLTGSVNP